METPRRFETGTGHWLVERDIDLGGRVAIYDVEGTDWRCVRLPDGWRAQRATGRGRPTYRGPLWESAPQTVRYLARRGYLGEPGVS